MCEHLSVCYAIGIVKLFETIKNARRCNNFITQSKQPKLSTQSKIIDNTKFTEYGQNSKLKHPWLQDIAILSTQLAKFCKKTQKVKGFYTTKSVRKWKCVKQKIPCELGLGRTWCFLSKIQISSDTDPLSNLPKQLPLHRFNLGEESKHFRRRKFG